jgi:hypothetical protein
MAKEGKMKKVKSRSSTKYATSSDEENSSDDKDNLLTLFANLNMQQKEKLNELISAIHEKDELLDSQEDFLIKENKKHVKAKNAYAQEIEKCEKLTSELSTCHDTISNLRFENDKLIAKAKDLNVCNVSIFNLRDENAILHAKIVELNACKPSTSTVEHVTCWGLVLKCYELRTRQHKMLNVNALRPSKHYFPKGIMIFGRRS